MKRTDAIIVSLSIVTLAYVFYVNRGVNGFSLWNSLPVLIAVISLLVDKSMTGLRYAIYGFSCTIILTILIVHIGYHVDVEKIMPNPLFSGKRIYGLPLYSVGGGYIVGMIGILIGTVRDGRKGKGLESPEEKR